MEPQAIDMQAIQEAMDRRKNGTMQSAPQPQPAMPPSMPTTAPAVESTPVGAPPETKESSVIVKALIDRLKQYSVK